MLESLAQAIPKCMLRASRLKNNWSILRINLCFCFVLLYVKWATKISEQTPIFQWFNKSVGLLNVSCSIMSLESAPR